MSNNIEKKLINYGKLSYNVMLSGKHGVGKTAIINEVFNTLYGKQGVDWLYFSASTMDPWVDFIGIPKNYTNSEGEEVFKIIPPENFSNNNVKALYFDEFNRADGKIRNAVMELLQFKSINGRRFDQLQCIWASINPADDENNYQVEELDPAQLDRFQIQIELPYDVSKKYFTKKFGKLGELGCQWWSKLQSEEKDLISPRRLEYILNAHQNNCDIRDLISKKIDTNPLEKILSFNDSINYIETLINDHSDQEIRQVFTINKIMEYIHVFNERIDLFDKIRGLISEDYTDSLLGSDFDNIKDSILKTKKKAFFEKIEENGFHLKNNYLLIPLLRDNDKFNIPQNFIENYKEIFKIMKKIVDKKTTNKLREYLDDKRVKDDITSNEFAFNLVMFLNKIDNKLSNLFIENLRTIFEKKLNENIKDLSQNEFRSDKFLESNFVKHLKLLIKCFYYSNILEKEKVIKNNSFQFLTRGLLNNVTTLNLMRTKNINNFLMFYQDLEFQFGYTVEEYQKLVNLK
jgi:hypothetical protein